MLPQPASILARVREDLANLSPTQRASTDALLVEHLAALADREPSPAVIRDLRSALAALVSETNSTTDPVDELQRRRRDRASRPERPDVGDVSR